MQEMCDAHMGPHQSLPVVHELHRFLRVVSLRASRRAELAFLVAFRVIVAHEEGALVDGATDVGQLHAAHQLRQRTFNTTFLVWEISKASVCANVVYNTSL